VSVVFSLFSLGVFAWSVRNAAALRSRSTVDASGPCVVGADDRGAVLVAGGTGFVGTALVTELRREGRRVIVLSRDPLAARGPVGGPVRVVDRLDDLPDETRIDAVVHLAGARVLGLPWTKSRRRVCAVIEQSAATATIRP
jgi:NADPH:quinone reductase-like Zn-dependent oxidoreductase